MRTKLLIKVSGKIFKSAVGLSVKVVSVRLRLLVLITQRFGLLYELVFEGVDSSTNVSLLVTNLLGGADCALKRLTLGFGE